MKTNSDIEYKGRTITVVRENYPVFSYLIDGEVTDPKNYCAAQVALVKARNFIDSL